MLGTCSNNTFGNSITIQRAIDLRKFPGYGDSANSNDPSIVVANKKADHC